MDSAAVAELIRNEHPQIVATILVHLEPDQSAEIMSHFVERTRNDVLLRIATLEGVQPAALRELNDVLTQLLSGSDKIKKKRHRRRTDGGRYPQLYGRRGRSVGGVQHPRIRSGTGAAHPGQDVHFRQCDGSGRPRHPAIAARGAIRFAGDCAQGHQPGPARKKSSRTCRNARPKCCATIWRPKARSSCPRSKPNRKKFSRSCAALPTKDRLCCPAKAKKAGRIRRGHVDPTASHYSPGRSGRHRLATVGVYRDQ